MRGRAGSRDPIGVTTISIGGGISEISQFQFYKNNRRKRNERAGIVCELQVPGVSTISAEPMSVKHRVNQKK